MVIRVIYKDKNIGIVSESRLENLISLGRIAAFCRPNDDWVGVGLAHTRPGGCRHEHKGESSNHVNVYPDPPDSRQGVFGVSSK